MNMNESEFCCNRREFARTTLLAGSALSLSSATHAAAAEPEPRRIRVGVIGCGSVSNSYLPELSKSAHVELVSVCDIRPERAAVQSERFQVPHHYPHIKDMLAGEPFDFLINLTDMQEHERLNGHASEPPVWFHDIFRRDGTAYRQAEVDYIRKVTGAATKK